MAQFRAVWRSALTGLSCMLLATGAMGQSTDLVGHGGPVKSIQVSKEGTHALSGSFDYSMIYWALKDGTPEKDGTPVKDGTLSGAPTMKGPSRATPGKKSLPEKEDRPDSGMTLEERWELTRSRGKW